MSAHHDSYNPNVQEVTQEGIIAVVACIHKLPGSQHSIHACEPVSLRGISSFLLHGLFFVRQCTVSISAPDKV